MVKLRDVLGDSASNPKYVETIAKRGYRFLGNTERIQIQDQPIATVKTQATVNVPQPVATFGEPVQVQPSAIEFSISEIPVFGAPAFQLCSIHRYFDT